MIKMPSPQTRAYIYRAAAGVLPLLTMYGVVGNQTSALWLSALGGVLVPGLAAANTSTKSAPVPDGGARPAAR